MPPPVLYEDAHMLAVSKPSGAVVVAGRGDAGEPLSESLGRELGHKLFVVHRLDRGASGVLLFAKDADSHRRLCAQFETRAVTKVYLAVVEGVVPADGRVDRPIRQFGSGRMGVDDRGKPSATDYRVVERFSAATMLEARPLTGRRHQVRVHLYSTGHPILGETRYGKDFPVGGAARLMLHALRLTVQSPEGVAVTIESPPPEDFRLVIDGLRARKKTKGAPAC